MNNYQFELGETRVTVYAKDRIGVTKVMKSINNHQKGMYGAIDEDIVEKNNENIEKNSGKVISEHLIEDETLRIVTDLTKETTRATCLIKY